MISWTHLLIAIVFYTVIAEILDRYYEIPDKYSISGPILTIRSQFGLNYIEELSKKYKRPLITLGTIGVISAIITGLIALIGLFMAVIGMFLDPTGVQLQDPTDILVVPGVNRFLPIEATPAIIIGLLIGMVVHEAGHALLCRTGNINIKSTGVILFSLLPLGAFVEPDEETYEDTSRKDQLRMFSAGIINNYIVFLFSAIVLFLIVSLLISPVGGISVGAVFADSPGEKAGLSEGDSIVSIDNNSVDKNNIPNDMEINRVELSSGEEFEVPEGLYIERSPEILDIEPGETIHSISGTKLKTPDHFQNELRNSEYETVEVELDNGDKRIIERGAYVTPTSESSLNNLKNVEESGIIIHKINNETVLNEEDFKDITTNSTGEVDILYSSDDGMRSSKITFEENPENNVIISGDISGISTSRLGISIYPTQDYYDSLSPSLSLIPILQSMIELIVIPVGSLIPGIEFGFPGFTTFIQDFFVVTGSDIPGFEWLIFFTATVLFWNAWVNVNLAIFNCIPAFFLDGGHILRATTELTLSDKLSNRSISIIVNGIQATVVLLLLAIIFSPFIVSMI